MKKADLKNLDPSESPFTQNLIRLGQFYELMFFVGIIAFMCGFLIRNPTYRLVWFAGWAFIAPAFLYLAYKCSYKALKAFTTTRFVLRKRLLETLNENGVPKDVVASLRKIWLGRPGAQAAPPAEGEARGEGVAAPHERKKANGERVFEGERSFFTALRKELGSARAREFMPVIFKYAKE